MKKIHARQLALKNIHAMAYKNKYSYKEFDNEKKIPPARKFPAPPTTFLMVCP